MKKFTAIQDEWLKEHFSDGSSWQDVTTAFNERFGDSRSKDTIRTHCGRCLNLRRGNKNLQFTEEHDKWLKENFNNHSNKSLTYAYNKHFNENRCAQVIKTHCREFLGLRFTDNKERLSKTLSERQLNPIGTIKKRKGIFYIKTKNQYRKDGWIPYGRYRYEKKYGEIPKDYALICIDGDFNNFDYDNWLSISRRAHRNYSSMCRYVPSALEDYELKKTLLMYCELMVLERKEIEELKE